MASFPGETLGRRRRKYLLLAAIAVLTTVWGGYRYHHRVRYTGVSRMQIDLHAPELLLATRNLAELPKDVAGTPILQGLVDEELVFHYEEDEVRLSLEGSLRRLAYEHNLELHDRLLSVLLSTPAEVGIWRSGKGRPEHFVVVLESNALGKLVEVVARIALDDRQLKLAGDFIIDGRSLPLLTLDIGGNRTFAFIAASDRWVFLSDPAMVLDEQNELTADAAEVLGELIGGKHPWASKLPVVSSNKHSLTIGPEAFTMNYAHFLPAIGGLRFNHDGENWHPELRINAQALSGDYDLKKSLGQLWRTVPSGAALCAALPIAWTQTAAAVDQLVQEEGAVAELASSLDPLGAVCWFADSRINAPLFVARAKGNWPVGADKVLAAVSAKSWSAEIVSEDGRESARYSATVPSVHGPLGEDERNRWFEPTLVRQGDLLLFSPDRRNVDAALAVAEKRAPAVGDLAGLQDSPAWLFQDPRRLGELTRAEVQKVLPAGEESFFRDIARQRLWPRLEAWGEKQSTSALVLGQETGDDFFALDLLAVEKRDKTTH